MVLRLAACLLLPIAVSTRTPRLAASLLRDAGPADYFELAPCRHGSPLAPPASGAAVIALQNALAGATWPTPEPLSGVFDAPTSESLRAFQAARGLAVDGIVGPATMAAFDAALGLAAAPSPGLLRISDAQVTPAITVGAERVLAADGRRDIGTEVAFQADNRTWVGRIELHYHPFNGTMRPWGYHHGVSVFCTLDSSCVAPGGAAFLAATAGMTVPAREAAILQQLLARNMPPWLLSPPSLAVMVAGSGHVLTFRAMPDVLAIGGADDFVRIPVAAPTAQRVADAFAASLPTTKMVDLITAAAAVRVQPVPLPPSVNMTSNAYFSQSEAAIEAELAAAGSPPRERAVAGQKKDIVVSNGYVQHPDSVCIFGWPWLNGSNIQELFCGHAATYADYSHGARLVARSVELDGAEADIEDVLRDPLLATLISYEGAIPSPRIPLPQPAA